MQGGAGGIGSIAIQIAKMHGAYVVTTVGTDSVDFAQNLGADEVIDYKVQDVTNVLRDYDAVFDTAGGDSTNDLFKIIKRGGTLVSMAGMLDQDLANKQGCLLYTSDAADDLTRVDLGGRRIIKPKN